MWARMRIDAHKCTTTHPRTQTNSTRARAHACTHAHALCAKLDLHTNMNVQRVQDDPQCSPPLPQQHVSATENKMAWEGVEAQQRNEMLGSNQGGLQQGDVTAYMHPSTPPRNATPPLPTEQKSMKEDELSNGNFSFVNQADAGAYNIEHRELQHNLAYPPPVSAQIRKVEDVEDVDLFDEIPDMLPENPPSASRETLMNRSSRPPRPPISKPTGFEDYALSPSSAAQIELLHRFDLDTLISSLPSVASPPMMSPEVQRRAEHTANSSSISQLVPTTLMPDLEQVPVYGAPVSRLGPDHDMRSRATSPQQLTQQTPSPGQRVSQTPDVHISHTPSAPVPAATNPYLAIAGSPGSLSPSPHSTTSAQPPPSPPTSQGGSVNGLVTAGKNPVNNNYYFMWRLGVASVRTNACVCSGTQRDQSFLTNFLIFLGKNFCPKTYNCITHRSRLHVDELAIAVLNTSTGHTVLKSANVDRVGGEAARRTIFRVDRSGTGRGVDM